MQRTRSGGVFDDNSKVFFSYFSIKTNAVCTYLNASGEVLLISTNNIDEVLLMSTQSIYFYGELEKIIPAKYFYFTSPLTRL